MSGIDVWRARGIIPLGFTCANWLRDNDNRPRQLNSARFKRNHVFVKLPVRLIFSITDQNTSRDKTLKHHDLESRILLLSNVESMVQFKWFFLENIMQYYLNHCFSITIDNDLLRRCEIIIIIVIFICKYICKIIFIHFLMTIFNIHRNHVQGVSEIKK